MNKKGIIIIAVVVALAVIVVAGAVALLGGGGANTYAAQMEKGNRYLEAGDYDNAILCFAAAIKLNQSNPEAYIALANAYTAKGQPELAAVYLRNGVASTGSFALQQALDQLEGSSASAQQQTGAPAITAPQIDNYAPETTEGSAGAVPVLNDELLNFLSIANYGDYVTAYGALPGGFDGSIYIAQVSGLGGSIYFMNTSTQTVINPAAGAPYNNFKPYKITLNNATAIFNYTVTSFSDMQSINGIDNLAKSGNEISFTARGCQITVGCDADGKVTAASTNTIVPPADNYVEKTSYTLYGRVLDAESGVPLNGAWVIASAGNGTPVRAQTDASGSYSMLLDTWGSHNVTVELSGYVTGYFEVYIQMDKESTVADFSIQKEVPVTTAPPETTPVETAPPAVTYTLSGKVINATNGDYVSGAVLRGYNGYDAYGSYVEATSDSSGDFNLTFTANGNVTIQIFKDGFIDDTFQVYLGDGTTYQDFAIVPQSSGGTGHIMRFVLSWNAEPYDLDGYLVGTSSDGSSCNVYYGNQTDWDNSGNVTAELDLDDRNGYGPETITLHDVGGSYDFIVNDYTSSGTMSTQGATVKIYVDDVLTYTLDICAGCENDWLVCHISDGSITVMNTPY